MKNLVLASASPRRKEIFEQLGINISVVESDIIEKVNDNEYPEQVVMSLSFRKAINVANKIKEGIIIAADTVVVKDGKILGKPKDKLDARKMLQMLSGDKHDVITGFAIIDQTTLTKVVDYELTEVYFKRLENNEIESYLNYDEYFDKAGAYAIQGKGSLLIEKINGCYFNVVGLPISKINILLKKHFAYSLL